MRAAVFGPSPGSRMKRTTSGGTLPLRFVSASISPCSTIWTIFSSIVLPIPCSSFARPSSASCATEPDVSRILRRGAAVGEHAKRLGAFELEQVGEQVELVRDVGVGRKRSHAPILRLSHGSSRSLRVRAGRNRLPADVQRAREPRGNAEGTRAARRTRARDRRQLARRHRRDRRPARGRARLRLRSPPRAQGRSRPGVPRRVPSRARRRRRTDPRDGLRLLP